MYCSDDVVTFACAKKPRTVSVGVAPVTNHRRMREGKTKEGVVQILRPSSGATDNICCGTTDNVMLQIIYRL